MTKPKFAYQVVFAALMATFIIVSCNNKKDEKKDDTKMEQKMDSSATKMDTGSTKPVQPGN